MFDFDDATDLKPEITLLGTIVNWILAILKSNTILLLDFSILFCLLFPTAADYLY